MSFTTRVRNQPEDGTTVTTVVRVPRHPRSDQPRFITGRSNNNHYVKAQDEWIGLGAIIGSFVRFDPQYVTEGTKVNYGLSWFNHPYLYYGTNPASRTTNRVKFLNVHLRARLTVDLDASNPVIRMVLIYDRFPVRDPPAPSSGPNIGNNIQTPTFSQVFGKTSTTEPTTATHILAPQNIDTQFRFNFIWQRRFALSRVTTPELQLDEFIDLSSFTSTYGTPQPGFWPGDLLYQPTFGQFMIAVLQETPTPNTTVNSYTGILFSNAAIRWSFIDIGLPS